MFEWQITPKDDGQFNVVFDPVMDGSQGGPTIFDAVASPRPAAPIQNDSISFS